MAKQTKKTTSKVGGKIAAGLVAAGAAAAAGYYFYGSSKAKQHRKIAAKWAGDMKKEVVREAKQLKKITPQEFGKIVDTVSKGYRNLGSIDTNDLRRAAQELKANLKTIQGEIQKVRRDAPVRAKKVRTAVKSAVKTVKKVAKKARK